MILKATNVIDHMKMYQEVTEYVNHLLKNGVAYNAISLEYVIHGNTLDGVHVVVDEKPTVYFKLLG